MLRDKDVAAIEHAARPASAWRCNLAGSLNLKQHFPDSRLVTLPHTGHQFGAPACVSQILTDFVGRGTTKGLRTRCAQQVVVPPFTLGD